MFTVLCKILDWKPVLVLLLFLKSWVNLLDGLTIIGLMFGDNYKVRSVFFDQKILTTSNLVNWFVFRCYTYVPLCSKNVLPSDWILLYFHALISGMHHRILLWCFVLLISTDNLHCFEGLIRPPGSPWWTWNPFHNPQFWIFLQNLLDVDSCMSWDLAVYSVTVSVTTDFVDDCALSFRWNGQKCSMCHHLLDKPDFNLTAVYKM